MNQMNDMLNDIEKEIFGKSYQLSDALVMHHEGQNLVLYNVTRHGGRIKLNAFEAQIILSINRYHQEDLVWSDVVSSCNVNENDYRARAAFDEYISKLMRKKIIESGNTTQKEYGLAGQYMPLYATIELTNCCNFRCTHCYKEASNKNSTYISDGVMKIFVERCAPHLYAVELTGGEATLHPAFEEFVEMINVPILNLLTNGSNISGISERTLLSFDQIQVSLYGVSRESYLRNAGIDAFDTVIHSLKRLVDIDAYTTVAITLQRNSYNDVEKYFELLEGIGISRIRFGTSLKLGRNESGISNWDISSDEAQAIRTKIMAVSQKYPHFDIGNIEELIEEYEHEDEGYIVCGAGVNDICLSERGIIRPCPMFPQEYFGKYSLEEYIALIESGQRPCYSSCMKNCLSEYRTKGKSIRSICPVGLE